MKRLRAKYDDSGEYLCAICNAPYMVYTNFPPYISCGECGWKPIQEFLFKIKTFFKKLFKK